MTDTKRILPTCLLLTVGLCAPTLHAQHAGDIGLQVTGDQLEVYGPLGEAEDTSGVYLGTFGDTGFPGFTSNPGFDAAPGSLPQGRVGFNVLDGLRRWDPFEMDWLAPEEVGEALSISFITLQTILEDDAVDGFDLAVQPDGGWHRHVNYELLPDEFNLRQPGVYRLDLYLYSTMGLADSEPFTILFDYEATTAEVADAIASMYQSDCPADFDGNGLVDGGDLSRLLGQWGSSGELPEDLSGDGLVDGQDLSVLLGYWGECGG